MYLGKPRTASDDPRPCLFTKPQNGGGIVGIDPLSDHRGSVFTVYPRSRQSLLDGTP